VRQISNVPAAIFWSVHSTLHTANTHARIPIGSTKIIMFSLQQNCSPLWGNQWKLAGKIIHNLQSFSCSGLWISSGANALEPYFRLQKTDKVLGHITPSLVMSVKH
jgi:hypothetical protein